MHRILVYRFAPLTVCSALLLSAVSLVATSAEPEETGSKEQSSAALWKPLVIPKALVVVGPWGDMFRWREALHAQGILYDDAYRAQNVYRSPFVQLVGMPVSTEAYFEYSIIVLVNVDAPALGPDRLEVMRRFVQQGGGLVVLGGAWAFSRGGYAGTPLEEMLPVTIPQQHRIPCAPEGAVLQPDASSKWPWKLAFEQAPRAFYTQQLVPREQASVELRAAGQPALVSGDFGHGRVVACGLTIHGEATGGSLAFWDWPDWPRVLGQSIEWASANRRLQPESTSSPSVTPLSADEIEKVSLDFQAVTDEFVTRFAASPSAPAAVAVFRRVLSERQDQVALSAPAIDALARYAQGAWEEPLLKLADALNPDRALRAAALELLGAARGPAAGKVLLSALDDLEAAPAPADGLRRLGDSVHVPTILRVYQRSSSLADFRNPDGEKSSGPVAARHGLVAAHAAVALYSLGEPAGTERMVELYREIRRLRRILANAAKRRVSETDPTGIAILKAIIDKRNNLAALESYLLEAAGPVPESQRESFLTIARAAGDEADVRWSAMALIHSPAGSHWSSLSHAQDGILRRLAQVRSAP